MPAAVCLCYVMPYYINDDESHFVPRNPQKGWIRAGEDRPVRALIWCGVDKTEERGVFSICTLILGEKTKQNQSQPSGPPMIGSWKWRLDLVNKCSVSAPHPRSAPFLQAANMTIWWIILFQGAWQCPYSQFVSSQCVSVSEPWHYHGGISVDSKAVLCSLCLWMWQSRGACMCNTVLTFGSLFGCIVTQG